MLVTLLGEPFWFDLLEKVISVDNAEKSLEKEVLP